MDLDLILKKYDYSFNAKSVALAPAKPRDSAQLLIYDRNSKKTFFDHFVNLPKYIPSNSVLVLNETKVLPARLKLKKPSGGLVRILYLKTQGNKFEVLADRKLEKGWLLKLNSKINFEVIGQEENRYFLKGNFPSMRMHKILEYYGETPIPPYLKQTPLKEKNLRKEYQTVFANKLGSVAAPTASLHFTPRLIKSLKKKEVEVVYVTLHVGIGTFAPVTAKYLSENKLHTEYFEIDKKAAAVLNNAKRDKRNIIAVGTTVVRSLESASSIRGKIIKLTGETSLFIQPGYHFRFVDSLITNFHVPKSSLLMLVSSLVGRSKLFKLYTAALRRNFKIFSFGDGMFIR